MTGHGRIALFLIALAVSLPLSAQQASSDDRIQQLEQKLNELLRQANALQAELQQLKGNSSTATPPADDLLNVEVVPPAATRPAASTASVADSAEQPQTAMTDVQTIENQTSPGASKVFNPDMSVVGNFLGKVGQHNRYEFGGEEPRRSMQFDEAEIALEAFVDPYAKAKFFIGVGPEGAELEEGFAQFLSLPHGFTAKAGKQKATFGKANTWHTHTRPWVDQPLVLHNFFGEEGLADAGISVSKAIANPWDAYVELTGEAFRGDVENVFGAQSANDLFYNGHLKVFKDFSDDSNLEVGASIARGTLPDGMGRAGNRFGGIDVTYRWNPLQRGPYRSLIARFEGIVNDRDDRDERLFGWFASADYRLARRWFTGVRLDQADRAGFSEGGAPLGFTDRGIAATLTFWPSEFSQLRTQLRRVRYGGAETVAEVLFQLQFAIGAHGAHTF